MIDPQVVLEQHRVTVPRVPRAEVKERVLDAAARLFAERGIHGTRLDEIAAEAGFSKGAVYSNFTSKDDLVGQLMRRSTTSVLDSIRAKVRPEVPAGELPDVIRAAFAPFAQVTNFALLSEFRLHALRHPEVLEEFVAQREALHAGVRAVIDAWCDARPELEAKLPRATLTAVLVATNVGLAFDAPALPGVRPGDVIAELTQALLS